MQTEKEEHEKKFSKGAQLTTGGTWWVLCVFVAMVTGGFVFVDDVRDLAARGRAVPGGTGSDRGRIQHFRMRLDEVVLVVGANLSKLQTHKIIKITLKINLYSKECKFTLKYK